MLKDEFVLMMKQDLATKNDETLDQLLMCFEETLKTYPSNTEINNNKSVEECYSKMYEYACKNKKGSSFVFTPSKTKEFIIEYLELGQEFLQSTAKTSVINLEDFI